MTYLANLLVQGALSGVVYAVVAVAFIVVHKSTRMANFALGEWVMLGALLTGAGFNLLPFGLVGALVLAVAGMFGLAALLNGMVLGQLIGRPAITVIMVTLGLGAVLRGLEALILRRLPTGLPDVLPAAVIEIAGVSIATQRLWAAVIAALCIASVGFLYGRTRVGIALRALADDQRAGIALGIDTDRYFTIAWGLAAVLCVVAGVLWTTTTGGGFGLALVGLKVFPIVVIGGLDSLGGALVAAVLVGIVESLAGGYLDPILGSGFGGLAGFMLLLIVLLARPHGLLGRAPAERI